MDTFGKRLVAARKKLDLTQKELADRLGITPTRLNYWEKDKREPDVHMIKQISKVLSVDPNYLIGVWSSDMYEDFQNANTKEEKLLLLERRGVPRDLFADYSSLISSVGSSNINSSLLTEEELSRISAAMSQMNQEGRERAVELVEDLAAGGRYKKTDSDLVGKEA